MVDLVLLPPMGHKSSFYSHLVKNLEGKYRKIHLLDYPVERVKDEDPIDTLVNHFELQIKKLNVSEFDLSGVSLGATLALRLKSHFQNCHNLYLMAPGGLPVPDARKAIVQFAIKNYSFSEMIGKTLGLNVEDFLIHFSQNQNIAKDYIESLINEYENNSKQREFFENIPYFLTKALEINYTDLFYQYEDQITILWGHKDRIFSSRYLRKFQKMLPNSNIVVFKNHGHYLPIEAPHEVSKEFRKSG